MKLTHEFLHRSGNATGLLFLCRSYDDYMAVMNNHFENIPTSYDKKEDFLQAAHELFVEEYLTYYSHKYGIFDLKYIPTKSHIHFRGKDINEKSSTAFAIFINTDRQIFMNADCLDGFANISRYEHNVSVDSKTNMFVVSNAKNVEETILKNAPTIKDKIVFILIDEISSNVTNNLDFWKTFQENVKPEKKIITAINSKYILRDFQNDAVEAMLKNKIGQISLPTATGKSIIQAEYILRYIKEKNSAPVIVVISPRIVLVAQLLKVIFSNLTSNKLDAQYINLSSGDMREASQEMFADMTNKGLIVRNIEATTNLSEIQKYIDKAKEAGIPLIISATYHSAWRLVNTNCHINVILCDEAHNLVMGRFSEDFKEETRNLQADNKFFFTATPCHTPSDDGKGMNNQKYFGTIIYTKSYREMIERFEILPIVIQTVDVKSYTLLKNKNDAISPDNMKDADFERDITAKTCAICDAFEYHTQTLKKNSANYEKNAPKLLVTIDGVSVLKGILNSQTIIDLYTNKGIQVFAISTEIRYFHNGTYYDGYDFKEKFMRDIKNLKDTDKAIILHIDMIGEGLDVTGITSVMAFSTQGTQKLVQLIGRPMRLHDHDRKKLYAGEFLRGMDRIKTMIKPYAYIIIPMFLDESADLKSRMNSIWKSIHTNYDWIPKVDYDKSYMIGDNENMNNQDFKGKCDVYNELTFKHELELDNLMRIMTCYTPRVSL